MSKKKSTSKKKRAAQRTRKPAGASGPARARAASPDAVTVLGTDVVQQRIDAVTDLMAAGQWKGRVTAKELAAEWDLSYKTVQHYALTASRVIYAASDEERDILRADTIARLSSIADSAATLGDSKGAVSALSERADIAGLKPRASQQVVMVQVQMGSDKVSVSAHAIAAQVEIIAGVLERFPEAKAAVRAALEAARKPASRQLVTVNTEAGEAT